MIETYKLDKETTLKKIVNVLDCIIENNSQDYQPQMSIYFGLQDSTTLREVLIELIDKGEVKLSDPTK